MAQFASATFTGTAFAELSGVDSNWSKQFGYAQDLIIGANGGCVICNNASNFGTYQHSGTPASADYEVSADIAVLNSNGAVPAIALCGRMQSGATTFYNAYWSESAGTIRLFKIVAGVQTQLGSSYTYTLTTTPARLKLVMNGSSISVALDGATVIGPVTDTSITTAGKAGISLSYNRETGVSDATSLDNFSGDDLAVASDLSGNVTLDAVAPAGTLADGGASGLSGGVTLDAVAPAGTLGVAPGAYSIPALTNWSGSVQAAVTVPWVTFQRLADGVQVLVLADQVTDGSGNLSGTNAALLTGTTYMACGWNADGSSRFARPVTAT